MDILRFLTRAVAPIEKKGVAAKDAERVNKETDYCQTARK